MRREVDQRPFQQAGTVGDRLDGPAALGLGERPPVRLAERDEALAPAVADLAVRARVNVGEDYEVRYWTNKWNVTPEQLRAAVDKVGVMADDVERELRRR